MWTCWQDRTPLQFESEHFNLSLMVPLFDPGPIEHPDIPIHVAAIGPRMCAVAGEVADGVRPGEPEVEIVTGGVHRHRLRSFGNHLR